MFFVRRHMSMVHKLLALGGKGVRTDMEIYLFQLTPRVLKLHKPLNRATCHSYAVGLFKNEGGGSRTVHGLLISLGRPEFTKDITDRIGSGCKKILIGTNSMVARTVTTI